MANTSEHPGVISQSHPQDFAEWNPNPIIEVNQKGEIIYFNLVARAQFPNLPNKGSRHPILAGLIDKIGPLLKSQSEFVIFSREIHYMDCIYEQQIFSVSDKTTIFVYMDDITARKHAENQLNKKNIELTDTSSFLNNILESSIEHSIIATDLNGIILTWNAGAKYNYGFEKNEMTGKNNISILHIPEDVQAGNVQRFVDTVLREGKAERDFEHVRKNGERFIASIVMSVRLDTEGKPMGYLLISKDVTEQKRLEEQLKINMQIEEQNILMQEASHSKSEFLSNMSHELRTPLNAIIGFSELMMDESLGPVTEGQKDALKDVLQSANNLLLMIKNMLDVAHIKFAKIEFKPVEINIKKEVKDIVDQFYALSLAKHVNLTIQIDESMTTVYLDLTRFKQILYNYLSNALKFIPEQGSVQVRVMPETDATFRIEVEDDGGGIKPEDIKKLFVTFQQIDSSVSKRHAGTGLGLSLTKHIVEAQGGEVGAICTAQKNIFYAILPRHYQPQT